jgi:hypothetical protein
MGKSGEREIGKAETDTNCTNLHEAEARPANGHGFWIPDKRRDAENAEARRAGDGGQKSEDTNIYDVVFSDAGNFQRAGSEIGALVDVAKVRSGFARRADRRPYASLGVGVLVARGLPPRVDLWPNLQGGGAWVI